MRCSLLSPLLALSSIAAALVLGGGGGVDGRRVHHRVASSRALLLEAAQSASATAAAINTTRVGVTCEKIGNVFTILSHACMCEPCNLCELHFSDMSCHLIAAGDDSDESDSDNDSGSSSGRSVSALDDGSKIKATQPELDAAKWFLTQDEMNQTRGGVARDDLALFSTTNNVTAFAAADEYYASVYADLEATSEGDRVFIAGWSFDDIPIVPSLNAAENNASMVSAVLSRMLDRGVEFHILGWANFMEPEQNIAFQALINAMPAPKHGKARFIFDDRVPDATSSNHQKIVAIKRAAGLVAYVGGLDLTSNRWDTLAHDQAEFRQQTGIERDDTNGWMDIQVKLDGPAATDVATNFLARWNMKRRPLEDLFDPLFDFTNPEYTDLPALSSESPLVVRTSGQHAVQVVRTFSCKYDHFGAFAPHGEVSVLHARIKALQMAQNYVYIEDQYFIEVPELLTALLEVLPRLQRLIIVTQPTTPDLVPMGYERYQYDAIAPLQEAFPNKVQVFRTKVARKLYVHSKLVIIDDVYLSIGSSNWNRRSMTADTEIAANIVDSMTVDAPEGITVNAVARDYRIRKFMELTGKSYEDLDNLTLLEASAVLDSAVADPKSVLDSFQIGRDVTYLLFGPHIQAVADPHYKC